jgi:hypothetical protein
MRIKTINRLFILLISFILIITSYNFCFSNNNLSAKFFEFPTDNYKLPRNKKNIKINNIKKISIYEVEISAPNSIPKILFSEEYNKNGQITLIQKFNSGKECLKYEYIYDSCENLIRKNLYINNKLSSYSIHSIDKTTKSILNFSNSFAKEINEFDENIESECVYEEKKDLFQKVIPNQLILCIYDINDKSYKTVENELFETIRSECIFDKKKKLIQQIDYLQNCRDITKFEYDSNENLIFKRRSNNFFYDSKYLETTEYSYDHNGNLLKITILNNWKKSKYQEKYIYDKTNRITKKEITQYSSLIKDKKINFCYKYNDTPFSKNSNFSKRNLDLNKQLMIKYEFNEVIK